MSSNASRREFLKRAGALSAAGTAAPWALNLATIGEAAAATATDYKALVCVFLYGGNDHSNTLVPYDADSHAAYLAQRPTFGTARADVAATLLNPGTPIPGGRQYALAPQLSPLLPIFNAGHMAVLLNIGTLVQPTTKAEYLAKSVPLPPKLFSHNDQQSVWQSSSPEGSSSGWGGRIGDLFASGNGSSTFTCINVGSNAVYLAGRSAIQYQMTPNGSVPLTALKSPMFGSRACSDLLKTLITAPRTHLFEAEHTRVMKRSIEADAQLAAALTSAPALATPFPSPNFLAAQLKMVARMISVGGDLGIKRQVFMVTMGGFDTHSDVAEKHPGLLAAVGEAMAAFYQATVELGVADKVTAFTASDFGRTLTSNGDGSDHGWGSMQFVVGDAVKGKSVYGAAPVVASNGPNDIGQGRLLPTTSVDQFGATLASWFGVSSTNLSTVMPNIGNYSQRNLGFFV